MVREICRTTNRHGGLQLGAAHRPECVTEQLMRHQRDWRTALVADRDVGFACMHVDHRVGPDDLERNVGMSLPP